MNKYPRITEYSICIKDTTLIGVDIKIMPDENENKYNHRWTDKSKRLSVSLSVKYTKNVLGYYQDYLKLESSRLFIIKRKKNKKELIIGTYCTKALPNEKIKTYTEFQPFSHRLYKMAETKDK